MVADLTLLERYLATRDGEALAAIVERFGGLVYGTCLRVLGNHADAEDAAQECFLRLVENAHRVRFSLAGWLHRCATRIALNARKQAGVRRRYERTCAERLLAADADERAWQDVAPHLDAALAELSPEHLHVVTERYLLQRSGAEIAREMKVSRVTFYRRLDEGIRLLRRKLRTAGQGVGVAALEILLEEHAAAAAPASLVPKLRKIVNAFSRTAAPPGKAAQGAKPLRGRTVTERLASAVRSLRGLVAGLLVTALLLTAVVCEVATEDGLAGLVGLRTGAPKPADPPHRPLGRPDAAVSNPALAAAVARIVDRPIDAPLHDPAPLPDPVDANAPPVRPGPKPEIAPAENEDDGPWDPFWITPDVPKSPSGPSAPRPGPSPAKNAPTRPEKPACPFAPPDVVATRIERMNRLAAAEAAARRDAERRTRPRRRRPAHGLRMTVTRGTTSAGHAATRSTTGLRTPFGNGR